ncbi:MAG: SGNH/GDSL hydrolase family protein [Actinomycetes bacterium]|jgi:lysophospholipase L1-like esterase
MPQAVSLLGRVMAAALAAVGMELAFAYLWPAPRQPEFDPSGTFGEEYPGPPIRLVALGDSTLTAPGVAAADEIWIRQVARRLADATRRPIELRSFGVSGSTSLDVLVEQLPEAIEFGPHLAIVSVGANDVIKGVSLRKLHDNLDRIVAALKGTGALVILSGVGDLGTIPRLAPPVRQMASRLGRRADRVHERVAERHGVVKADQWTWASLEFRRRRDVWSPDRFHPNGAGHEIWATTCWQALQPLCADLVGVRT